MAEWLGPLIISALNRLTAVGSSLAPVTCETSKFCLRVVRWFFSGISRFCPTYRLTWLKMSEIILMGHKTQIQKIYLETAV